MEIPIDPTERTLDGDLGRGVALLHAEGVGGAGVVSSILQFHLFDDQTVVVVDYDVREGDAVHLFAVLQPVHLQGE